ncbi:hypothetical protein ALNOE001_09820 [Candidatus Methanobinarius endosymbioticus]|uniref:Uncharacterized protein n=1 Tax=Candidatus Methanobinarius endosymbioticus TaxID=2006182 RepID=A0A366MAZ1_9EURY|nr:hypothetical protein ALNOE001_09820 [Candidatus Methanobinarius endosymbioticus]
MVQKKKHLLVKKSKNKPKIKSKNNAMNKKIQYLENKIENQDKTIKNLDEKLDTNRKQINSLQKELEKYTQIYDYKRINKEQIGSFIENFKGYGIKKDKKDIKLIISLTYFPERMYDSHYCLYSLLTQKLKSDELISWLSKEKFPNLEEDVPKKFLILKSMTYL